MLSTSAPSQHPTVSACRAPVGHCTSLAKSQREVTLLALHCALPHPATVHLSVSSNAVLSRPVELSGAA